jgi:AcrR family transcriptional regulator
LRIADPTTISGNELKKSAATRTNIMEAAVDCLAETGYQGTTTTTVSDRANLTRAAMLYHFPSRLLLIEAVVHYVTRERIKLYTDALARLPREGALAGAHIDVYWEQAHGRLFRAFDELRAAARTDPKLGAIFNPAMAEFDRARRQTALEIYPQHLIDKPYFDLRRDVTRYLIEGLASLDAPIYNSERRIADILNLLKTLATAPEGEALLMRAVKTKVSKSR